MRIREREKYGIELLADEWAKAKENSGFLIANASENWADMDWFASRYIKWNCYHGKTDLEKRVKEFMEKPVHKSLIRRKVVEGITYRIEVGRLKNIHHQSAT